MVTRLRTADSTIKKHHVQLVAGLVQASVGIYLHAISKELEWGNASANIKVLAFTLLSIALLATGFRLLLAGVLVLLATASSRTHDKKAKLEEDTSEHRGSNDDDDSGTSGGYEHLRLRHHGAPTATSAASGSANSASHEDDHHDGNHRGGASYWLRVVLVEPLSLSNSSTRSTSNDQTWIIGATLLLTILSGLVLSTYSTGTGRTISQRYHQIVIVGMFALLFGILLVVHLARRYRLFTWRRALGLVAFVVLATTLLELAAYHRWPRGIAQLQQSLEYEWPHCSLPRCLPHRYIFPRRLFNFFMGSEVCPASPSFLGSVWPWIEPYEKFATLNDGVLTIQCQPHERASYITKPDFFDGLSLEQLDSVGAWTYGGKQHRAAALLESNGSSERAPTNNKVGLIELALNTERVPYTTPVAIDDEWVRAFCDDREVMPIQVTPRKHLLEREQQQQQQQQQQAASGSTSVSQQERLPDILLLMIDSVSRPEFHHSMPRTSRVLGELHTLDAARVFEFFRFHSVARHTLPNLAAMLTGLSEAQKEKRSHDGDQPHGFVWSLYREQLQYVTAYMLDMCADYFYDFRIEPHEKVMLGLDHEFVLPFCHSHYLDHSLDSPFNGPYSIRRRCIAGKKVHQYQFEYLGALHRSYPTIPKFMFAQFLEGHESSLEVLHTMDSDTATFLSDLYSDPQTSNTITIFFSDHGNHMSTFKYWTTCGDTECSFPFMFMLFPPEFLATRPDAAAALQANQQHLITGYDVFATLYQLFGELGGKHPTLESIRNSSSSDRHAFLRAVEMPSSSAKSLFEPVSNRTCAQAGIPNKFCRCIDSP